VGLRDLVATVAQSSTDALAALADRRIGKAYGLKIVFGRANGADVNFHFDDAGVNAVYRGALRLEEHGLTGFLFPQARGNVVA